MRKFIYILIALLVIGCGGSDRPSKPDNLIPKDTMSNIIYDVFLLNAAKGINKRVLEQNGVLPQEYVYKKYKIDSLQFAKSNEYYSYDTKTYEAIMGKVKLKIEFEKKKNDSIAEKDEKTKDSLRKERNRTNDTINQINTKLSKLDTLPNPEPKVKPKVKSKVFGKDNI